jgi:hypothetical protein
MGSVLMKRSVVRPVRLAVSPAKPQPAPLATAVRRR